MRETLFTRLCALLAVAGLLAAMASPVSAAKPEKIIVHDEFDEEICGIPVHTTVDGWSILHIQRVVIESTGEGTDDFWIGVIQDHYDVTWTNEAGVTMTQTVRQTVQEGDLVDNGDSTWTYTNTINGMPEFLRVGNTIINKDRGRVSFEVVFNFHDLSTFEDNEVISAEVTGIQGPHPTAESDFELFCQNIIKVLG